MRQIIVPTINNNDTQALLVEWLKPEGSQVQKSDLLAVLETSKSTYDLKSESEGWLHISARAGQEYPFGASLGTLFESAAEREEACSRLTQPSAREKERSLVITKAAQELIQKYNISEEQLHLLGRSVIKAKDLDPLVPTTQTSSVLPSQALSVQQQGIARMVSRSHATIPKSVVIKKIYCERALEFLAQRSKSEKIIITLTDRIVHLLGALPQKFPLFFGSLNDDLTFTPSAESNVGVTFDVGGGVFIPVIKNVGALSLEDVARQMMLYRMKAVRNTFKNEELSGASISLSINTDTDTIFVDPILPLMQTCMLSLGAVQNELVLEEENRLQNHKFVFLAAAFDHRAINGYQANVFLNELKTRIEKD